MKKMFKKTGKFFIELNQKQDGDIHQTILLIDGSFMLPNNLILIIKNIKKRFKNANLAVLTFQDREEFIRNNFPEIEVIVSKNKFSSKNYQLIMQLLLLLQRKFGFIVLASLDIFPVLISLIFFRCPVLLHSRWLEWYMLKPRTLSDVMHRVESADRNRRTTNRGMGDIIKSFGRIFIILCDIKEQDLKSRILIADNGYSETGHILTAVRKAQGLFINPDITILTSEQRKQDFINCFPEMNLAVVENNIRNVLNSQMYRMRKDKFNHIILTALEIVPISISLLCFQAEVLLYNRWHQWWSLRFRNILGYLKKILIFLIMIPVYIYLFIATGLILFSTGFRSRLKYNLTMDRQK